MNGLGHDNILSPSENYSCLIYTRNIVGLISLITYIRKETKQQTTVNAAAIVDVNAIFCILTRYICLQSELA